MKTRSAFTIVELLAVVSVIAILSAITIFVYNGAQKDARDTARKGTASVISEALEKYYEKNGEYPSVASLVSDDGVSGQTVAEKLEISVMDLRMPSSPAEVTNPLTSTTLPTNDSITYTASSGADDVNCQNDPDGGCDQFLLQYKEESGQTVTINGRHRSRSGA